MNDLEMTATWSTLDPSVRRRTRIEARLLEWLEAGDTSLAAEWLGLLKLDPMSALALASTGAVSLVLLTPVGWLMAALLP
jgi:hypothetical protein